MSLRKRALQLLAMVALGLAIFWLITTVGTELGGLDEDIDGDGDPFAPFLFLFLPLCLAGLVYVPACLWVLLRTGRDRSVDRDVLVP